MASKQPEKAKGGGEFFFFSFLLALGNVPGGMVLLQAGGGVWFRVAHFALLRSALPCSIQWLVLLLQLIRVTNVYYYYSVFFK